MKTVVRIAFSVQLLKKNKYISKTTIALNSIKKIMRLTFTRKSLKEIVYTV